MAKKVHFYFRSRDQRTKIHAVRWVPQGEIEGILQIAHGMAEHIERYDEFANYLADKGILVTGHDHLGHGKSVRGEEYYGYFSEYNGNQILLKDIHRLKKLTEEKYPQVPYYILGHSMGSFYVRQYLCRYGKGIQGAVIMGTGSKPVIAVKAGIFLTSVMGRIKGWHYRSKFIDSLTFGGYGKKIKNSKTSMDWLTKDEIIVNSYIADKRCGFMFTLNAYYHLFTGLLYLSDINNLVHMPKHLSVLFASGEEDPVGNYGKDVQNLVKTFKDVGLKTVDCKLYANDRHEILNETDRKKVYADLFKWLSGEMRKNHEA